MADSLKLRIGPQAGGVAPVTLSSPAGDTAGPFDTAPLTVALPLVAPAPQKGLLARLNDHTNRAQAEVIGRALFHALTADPTLLAAWNAALSNHDDLPLELEIDEPSLRPYPWELLWDDADRRPARLAGLLRRSPAKAKQQPANSDWPFRLLVIVGTDDGPLPLADQIGAKQEIGLLRRTLADVGRSIDINVLMLPAQGAVQKALKTYQPHAVHFIGHGMRVLATGRDSLVIEHAQDTWYWDPAGIGEDFSKARCVPRFVLLNACRSASDSQANIGLQQAFVERVGVGVVLAMQADVRGDLAARFSEAFYAHALAAPGSPDLSTCVESLSGGRRALSSDSDLDWGLPVLTLCNDIAVDVKLMRRRAWPVTTPFRSCREFEDARVYADDSVARRRMIEWFYPIDAAAQPNLLIVKGKASSGKSRLLHWCMESWAGRGVRVRYMQVDRPRGKNCLQWLIRLRAGEVPPERTDAERFLKEELPLAPFLSFYDAVARAAGLLDGPNKVESQDERVKLIDTFKATLTDNVSLEPLFGRFVEGLRAIGPIVLVFDQVSEAAINPLLFAVFRDSVLAPIAAGPGGDVRIALAVNDYEQFNLAGFDEQLAAVVPVRSDYTVQELEDLAVEALRYKVEAKLRAAAKAFLDFPDARTGLARLSFCQNFLAMPDFSDLGRMR